MNLCDYCRIDGVERPARYLVFSDTRSEGQEPFLRYVCLEHVKACATEAQARESPDLH